MLEVLKIKNIQSSLIKHHIHKVITIMLLGSVSDRTIETPVRKGKKRKTFLCLIKSLFEIRLVVFFSSLSLYNLSVNKRRRGQRKGVETFMR